LPYIEQQSLYDLYDFNKQSTEGFETVVPSTSRPVSTVFISTYACPSNGSARTYFGNLYHTSYLASAGPVTHPANTNPNGLGMPCNAGAWNVYAKDPQGVTRSENDPVVGKPVTGVFTRHKVSIPVTSITDGLSNTIYFGETLARCSNAVRSGWSNSSNSSGYCSTIYPINYDSCDENATDPCRSIYNWNTASGFKSDHPSGAHFLFGDGRVVFVSQSIDHQTYQYLGARADGQAISAEF
jgi:prepilin-type processing-associated H-X9-DG protein